VDSKGNVIT